MQMFFFFTQIFLFVQTWEIYMSICLHNTVVNKMHNIPVKTMGLGEHQANCMFAQQVCFTKWASNVDQNAKSATAVCQSKACEIGKLKIHIKSQSPRKAASVFEV